MIKFITFQISAETYSGFQYKIPYNICKNMTNEDIIKEIKINMKHFFTYPHDFYLLRNGIDDLQLHIHDDRPFNSNDIVYVCNHCHW